jgi:hypothetical protein
MKFALFIGLALVASSFVQLTALALNTLGLGLPVSRQLNVYFGWLGAATAVVAGSVLMIAYYRRRWENS